VVPELRRVAKNTPLSVVPRDDHADPLTRAERWNRSAVRRSLQTLAVLAVFWSLYAARDLLAPMLLAVLVAVALSPLVRVLARFMKVWIASAVVIIAVIMVAGLTAFALSDEAVELGQQLPRIARDVRIAVTRASPSNGLLGRVQQAAAELERAAEPAPATPATPVTVVTPVDGRRSLMTGAWTVAGWSGNLILFSFFVFALLSSGDMFRRKLVRISGEHLSRRKVTVQALDEMTSQIRAYLFYQVWSGMIVGAVTAGAFAWLRVEHYALLGVAAGVLNSVPYLGPALVMIAAAAAALSQFGSLGMAAAVGLVSLVITSLEGFVLCPLVLGRASRTNTVAVFVSLMFWTWLWGPAGLVLAVPILMIVKSIASRVESLAELNELLADE
jgi:predicted PurR-regulated permease PerM